MTDTQQRSQEIDEGAAQPQRLEREVIKDLEVSEELADAVKGGNRPTTATAPTGPSVI